MSPDALFWRGLLSCLLATACATDLRARRIPNALVAAVLALGLTRAAALLVLGPAGAGPLAPGLGAALLGVAAGLAAWLPLYALGVLGAGDVKLFAAACAWLGPHGVLPASVYAALAGGVLGVVWFARGAVAARVPVAAAGAPGAPRPAGDTRVPYGLAIAAGVLAAAWGAAL